MNYGIKQVVNVDEMIEEISKHRGERIDWVNKAKHSLFSSLGEILYNNYNKDVIAKYDETKNEKTIELELVVFGKKEYEYKIQQLKNIISNLDYETQKDILKSMDSDIEIKPKRKYI
jgi:hypothetical protein